MRVVVAGLGSPDRGDDGVGPLVAADILSKVHTAEVVGRVSDPLDLLGLWDGADLAIVVDALRSGACPGTIFESDLGVDGGERAGTSLVSTHGIGLLGAVRIARAIGAGPRRAVLVSIEGEHFGWGVGLSRSVAAAVPTAVRRVVGLIEAQSDFTVVETASPKEA